jgi:hypothetical protein
VQRLKLKLGVKLRLHRRTKWVYPRGSSSF